MVYQRYVVKKGRKYGPYFYETVLGKDGKVRSMYLGKKEQAPKTAVALVKPKSLPDVKIALLQRNIEDCDKRKEEVRRRASELYKQYQDGKLTYSKYELLLNHYLHGKSAEFWLKYYENYKLKAQEQINKFLLASAYSRSIADSQESETGSQKDIVQQDISSKVEELDEKVSKLESIVKEKKRVPVFELHELPLQSKLVALIVIFLVVSIPGSFLIQGYFSKQQPLPFVVPYDSPNISYGLGAESAVMPGAYEESLDSTVLVRKSLMGRIFETLGRLRPSVTGFAVGPVENIFLDEGIAPEHIEEETLQLAAEINKPVGWVKRIKLGESSGGARVEIPAMASGIKARKIEGDTKEEVSLNKLKLKKDGSFEPLVGDVFPDSDTVLLIEENITEAEIEFYTQAPLAIETEMSAYRKQIVVSSSMDYENVLAYTNITELTGEVTAIKLYWLVNETRVGVRNISHVDSDNNGLIDSIEWTVPHLSNQTYEVEITIINVQSYPMVGGNWTVMFNTTGKANLTITAHSGTTWTDYSEEGYDLKFLEIRCGGQLKQYEWVNNSVFIPDYECGQIAYETSKVLTPGKHTLEFDFGGTKAYARNAATVQVLPNYDSIYTGEGRTDLAYQACPIGSLDGTTEYCGLNQDINSGEAGYVNSTHPYNVPLIADVSSVFVCTKFFCNTAKCFDAAGDWGAVYVGQNSSGTWVYTELESVIGVNASWKAENMHCYNVTNIIDSALKARNVRISTYYYDSDDNGPKDIQVMFNYVNITYSAPDYPAFDDYSVNSSILGPNEVVRFNMSVVDPSQAIDEANGTINGENASFTSGTGDEWYYDWQCTSSDSGVNFTAAWAKDVAGYANTTVVSDIGTVCDADAPTITNAKINASSPVALNTVVKVNATVTDGQSNLGEVTLTIIPPISPAYNVTPTQSGDEFYNETIALSEYGLWVFRFFANDTVDNNAVANATDYITNNQHINVSNQDYPLFDDFSVNETIVANNEWIKFNMSVTDASDTVSAANGTINGANVSFILEAGDEWYYQWQCTSSDNDVGFTAAWANDTGTPVFENFTAVSGISAKCDVDVPTISNARINATSTVDINTVVKVNATVIDGQSNLANVTLAIFPPISPAYNVTPTQDGNEFYNNTIVLSEAGKWVFRFFANDTAGNNAVATNATDLGNNQHIEAASGEVAPVVYDISTISSQSITESSYTDVSFFVLLYDSNGIGTVANSSAVNATARLTGEETRYNTSCERVANINTTAANYSCTIQMWYWDGGGDWTLNVSTNDTSGLVSDQYNETFVLGTTTAMVMAPTSLSWGSINMSSLNQTATDDPLRINNTANKDVAAESLKVRAIDMQGGDIASEYLRAANFRVYNETSAANIECAGNVMANATALAINGTALPAGNNTNGQGNTTLYVCLFNVTRDISPQTYSTTVTGKWTVSIS